LPGGGTGLSSEPAGILDIDVAELCKLAGRDVGGSSFESQVPSELQQLRREMRTGFKRLDEAIAGLNDGRKQSLP
jgi:hypothetical protein